MFNSRARKLSARGFVTSHRTYRVFVRRSQLRHPSPPHSRLDNFRRGRRILHTQWRYRAVAAASFAAGVIGIVAATSMATQADRNPRRDSDFLRFSAPAGDRPATAHTSINGLDAAVLPNGRLVTPAGVEVSVEAPK